MKRKTVGCLLLTASVLASVCGLRILPSRGGQSFDALGRSGVFSAPAVPEGTVSVNQADAEELITLPGIGETMAGLILEERELHGPFFYPEDLLTIRGIGPSRLEKLRPLLDLSPSP